MAAKPREANIERRSARSTYLLNLPRSPQRAARLHSGVFAIFQNLHAVHENMFHPDRILMRLFEGGAVAIVFDETDPVPNLLPG